MKAFCSLIYSLVYGPFLLFGLQFPRDKEAHSGPLVCARDMKEQGTAAGPGLREGAAPSRRWTEPLSPPRASECSPATLSPTVFFKKIVFKNVLNMSPK